jgi:hypothetical protein
MPDRPNFPIPDELTPDTFCLCLQIPNNEIWKQVFAGLLAQPMYWFNWQRDPDHSGKILSQYWQTLFDQIDWSDMSCCCPDPQIRLNSDGSISVSNDGGATWQTDNSKDPRYTSPQFPPIPGDDGDDKKCKAANSIVRQLKDNQIGYSSKIGVITTVLEMAAALVGLAVLVFATAGLGTFLIGAFFELASALLATTSTAYDALFTDDDWSWVLCELYCKMTTDGQIPADQFINIQADFDSHFSGNAALTFSSILGAWQLPGLNNAAKIPTTDNLDCSGCCPACDTPEWQVYGARGEGTGFVFGTETARTSISVTVDSVAASGSNIVILWTNDPAICCAVDIDTGGATVTISWIPCGGTFPVTTGIYAPSDCTYLLQLQSLTTFTAIFTMNAC